MTQHNRDTDREIHTSVLAVSHETRPGESIDPAYVQAVSQLADRLPRTIRNKLLIMDWGERYCRPFTGQLSGGRYDIPAVLCRLPGGVELPGTMYGIVDASAARIRRPMPSQFVGGCLGAVRNALVSTDLIAIDSADERQFTVLSGPEPLTSAALADRIRTILPKSNVPMPDTALAFANELGAACNAVFELVTGSERLPRIACEVGYLTLQ
jgi:hypothetical protein